MDTYEALLNRRSIRKYLKDPVSPELIQKIMTAAIWAPSGGNSQPWRFFVASGKKRDELIDAMIQASGPKAPLDDAYDQLVEAVEEIRTTLPQQPDYIELGIRRSSKEGAQFIQHGSTRFYQAPVIIIVGTPRQLARGAQQSIGAAVENILLAAHAEGLATCWLGMPLAFGDTIIKVLNIPEDITLVTSICMGYPDKDSSINKLVMPRLPFDETVHLIDQ